MFFQRCNGPEKRGRNSASKFKKKSTRIYLRRKCSKSLEFQVKCRVSPNRAFFVLAKIASLFDTNKAILRAGENCNFSSSLFWFSFSENDVYNAYFVEKDGITSEKIVMFFGGEEEKKCHKYGFWLIKHGCICYMPSYILCWLIIDLHICVDWMCHTRSRYNFIF